MGWYLRKSFSFGPLRLNLSKSGLGYSFGVKGARIGTGPRGNYIHMGRYGLYYRQYFSQGVPSQQTGNNPAPIIPANTDTIIGSIIPTADVSRFQDTSAEDLLSHIREQHKKRVVAPWITTGAILILVVMFAREVSLWLIASCSGLVIVAHFLVSRFDAGRKRVTLCYKLDDSARTAYEVLLAGLKALSSSRRIWRIITRDLSSDPKYTAGATQLLNRKDAQTAWRLPTYFEVNVPIWSIDLGGQTLYFFPDRVLAYQGGQIGSLSYADLTTKCYATTFIESDGVPADARVVGLTWRYTNKGGGLDRRFAYNPQIPIAEYGAVSLRSKTGLNIELQCSNVSASQQFVDGLSKYCLSMMKDSTSHTTAVLAQPEDESSFRESALAAWGWTAAPVLFLVLVLALLFGRHDTYLRSAQVPAVTESVQPQQPLPDIRVLRRKGTQIVVAVPANTPDSDLSRVVESIRDKIKSSHPSDLQLGSTYPGVSASSGTILVFRTDGVRVPPLAKSDAVIRWKGTESAATLRDTIGTRSELAASRERLTKVRSAQTNDSNENQTASDSKERLNGNSEPSSLRFSSADADHYAGGIQNSARVNGNLEVLSDTAGVDFEAYLSRVLQSIRMNWYNLIPEEARAPVFKEGNVSIEFVIMPDGKIAGMKVVGPSGDVELDRAAWGGITASAPFAPLPTEFHGPYLALRFRFRYNSQHDNSK